MKASPELKGSLGGRVWGVLNRKEGYYVPLQISDSSIDYSILASAKTAVSKKEIRVHYMQCC